MSDRWLYREDVCDGHECIADCDSCRWKDKVLEVEGEDKEKMMNDLISRRKAFEYFVTLWNCIGTIMDRDEWEDVCMTTANEIPSAKPQEEVVAEIKVDTDEIIEWLGQKWYKPNEWVPCSERLPVDGEEVNITWINTQPESYYAHIKNKPFVGTGIYYDGAWWWYSCVCQDLLYETGRSGADKMDDAIKVLAWMPLPKPYKGEYE